MEKETKVIGTVIHFKGKTFISESGDLCVEKIYGYVPVEKDEFVYVTTEGNVYRKTKEGYFLLCDPYLTQSIQDRIKATNGKTFQPNPSKKPLEIMIRREFEKEEYLIDPNIEEEEGSIGYSNITCHITNKKNVYIDQHGINSEANYFRVQKVTDKLKRARIIEMYEANYNLIKEKQG